MNDPFTRGYREVKKFIKICKLGKRNKRCFSNKKTKRVFSTTKSKSLSHRNSDLSINFTLKKWVFIDGCKLYIQYHLNSFILRIEFFFKFPISVFFLFSSTFYLLSISTHFPSRFELLLWFKWLFYGSFIRFFSYSFSRTNWSILNFNLLIYVLYRLMDSSKDISENFTVYIYDIFNSSWFFLRNYLFSFTKHSIFYLILLFSSAYFSNYFFNLDMYSSISFFYS